MEITINTYLLVQKENVNGTVQIKSENAVFSFIDK